MFIINNSENEYLYILEMTIWILKLNCNTNCSHSKEMKHLNINLTQHVEDLHAENYKALMSCQYYSS